MDFPERHPMSRKDMGGIAIAVAKDIGFLENFGRLSALLPININWDLKNGRKLPYNIGLALSSVCLICFTSIWEYDSLEISKLNRNSDKIHAGLFYLSLWISSSIGRLALLLVVPQAVRFFRDLRAHVANYVPKDAPVVRRGFKVTCLIILNFIYFILLIQYIVKEWKAIGTNRICNRLVFPCDNTVTMFLLSIVIEFMSSASLYFHLYFVIVISDLLGHLLFYFKTKIILHLDSTNYDQTCSLVAVTTAAQKPFKIDNKKRSLPMFLSDMDPKEPSYDMLRNNKMVKNEKKHRYFVGNGKITLDNSKTTSINDLHGEFSQLKKLYNQLNSTLGPSMGVAFLADTLIIICIMYTICLRIGIETGQLQQESGKLGSLNIRWDNETSTMRPLVNEVSSQNSGQEFWSPFFATLHEGRSILLAFIGSHLRNQITLLKDKLERKVAVSRSDSNDHLASPLSKSLAVSVAKRVQKWTWEFRFLDMMTVGLSLIPAMIGTVMTYVVVLLQIRLSEGP